MKRAVGGDRRPRRDSQPAVNTLNSSDENTWNAVAKARLMAGWNLTVIQNSKPAIFAIAYRVCPAALRCHGAGKGTGGGGGEGDGLPQSLDDTDLANAPRGSCTCSPRERQLDERTALDSCSPVRHTLALRHAEPGSLRSAYSLIWPGAVPDAVVVAGANPPVRRQDRTWLRGELAWFKRVTRPTRPVLAQDREDGTRSSCCQRRLRRPSILRAEVATGWYPGITVVLKYHAGFRAV